MILTVQPFDDLVSYEVCELKENTYICPVKYQASNFEDAAKQYMGQYYHFLPVEKEIDLQVIDHLGKKRLFKVVIGFDIKGYD